MNGNDNIVGIILSRMTSSRLPGKALVDICGKPNLQYMIERVRRAKRLSAVCVATTTNDTDDSIETLCIELGVPVFRGSEDNVLDRITRAAQYFNSSVIVRLTADCPMIDPVLIDDAIGVFCEGRYDYVANGNVRSFPDGMDVEVIAYDALARANKETTHPFLREHVTPYIRGSHPQYGKGDFLTRDIIFEADFSNVRWTLDTLEDLMIIRKLCDSLPEGYTWLQALAKAVKDPELLNLKSYQIKS